jgi:hypothetical protein
MKKIAALIAILTSVSLLLPTQSFAQPGMMRGRGGGGWGPGTQYGRMYNPQTVETISGMVVSIDRLTPIRGMSQGVHLILKTARQNISVHLGPAWYLESQDLQIKPGDTIEVRGSRITFAGRPVIIAAEVKKQDQILTLRDNNGFPVWSGWRRFNRQSGF